MTLPMGLMAVEARRRLEERRAALDRCVLGQAESAGETIVHDLAETQAAIDRIEVGTYGRCERCGGAIGRQRLLAFPSARYCIAGASDVRGR
jgi:DnaK suppressor protein